MGSVMTVFSYIVPIVTITLIILFNILAGTSPNDAFTYTVRGVEVSFGAMGYKYNGLQAYPKRDWQYDLPHNIHESIPPVKNLLFAHCIGGILFFVYLLMLVIGMIYIGRRKAKDADIEFRIMRYQGRTLLYHIFPFCLAVTLGGLDFGYIRKAMALNSGLPRGTPPIFALGPYGILIFVAHAFAGVWLLWVACVGFYFRGKLDWRNAEEYRKAYWDQKDAYDEKEAKRRKAEIEAAKSRSKGRSSGKRK